MKTKNNVQKTLLRSVAVVTSFVLLSLTVTAQGYWKQLLTNNSFNQIAIALVENQSSNLPVDKSSESHSSLTASFDYFYEANDNELKLEPWMINSGYFDFANTTVNEFNDSKLSPESWMINSSFFEVGNNQDESLEIEAWMTNDSFWNI